MAEKVTRIKLNDGNQMPIVGYGTYEIKGEEISMAIEAGYRHFDGADFYQNEEVIGKYLSDAFSAGKVKREDLFIVSKVWPTWHRKGRPTLSAQRSLKNLGLDYVDLLLIHWPMQFEQGDVGYPLDANGNVILDETIDLVELWKEFEDIKRAGSLSNIN